MTGGWRWSKWGTEGAETAARETRLREAWHPDSAACGIAPPQLPHESTERCLRRSRRFALRYSGGPLRMATSRLRHGHHGGDSGSASCVLRHGRRSLPRPTRLTPAPPPPRSARPPLAQPPDEHQRLRWYPTRTDGRPGAPAGRQVGRECLACSRVQRQPDLNCTQQPQISEVTTFSSYQDMEHALPPRKLSIGVPGFTRRTSHTNNYVPRR
jgi:hypothetical protein